MPCLYRVEPENDKKLTLNKHNNIIHASTIYVKQTKRTRRLYVVKNFVAENIMIPVTRPNRPCVVNRKSKSVSPEESLQDGILLEFSRQPPTTSGERRSEQPTTNTIVLLQSAVLYRLYPSLQATIRSVFERSHARRTGLRTRIIE